MKYILCIIIGFFIGFCVAMAAMYHNYKEIAEPSQVMADKLAFCDGFGEKTQAFAQYQPKDSNITAYAVYLKNYSVLARQYFQCVQTAYNFSYSYSKK